MENYTQNPLEMGARSYSSDSHLMNNANRSVQDLNAEDVAGTIAKILFWGGTVVCGLMVLVGLGKFGSSLDSERFDAGIDRIVGGILFLLGVIIYLFVLVAWSNLKMKVNISRNLFVVKESLLNGGKSQTATPSAASVSPLGNMSGNNSGVQTPPANSSPNTFHNVPNPVQPTPTTAPVGGFAGFPPSGAEVPVRPQPKVDIDPIDDCPAI